MPSVLHHRFWSVMLGCKAIRISAFDANGDEHHATIRDDGVGLPKRERRHKAVELVLRHIKEGRAPGEVGMLDGPEK